MKRSRMICLNCIFCENGENDYYCHLNAEAIVDDDDDHIIDFPVIHNPSAMWCGQGEWRGSCKDDPSQKVLYRWGEWTDQTKPDV